MAFPKGTRAGLLLILTAGPFLVFLFLHLFGKNHFELDRYPLSLDAILKSQVNPGPEGLLLMDTSGAGCRPGQLRAQLRRFSVFSEDFGKNPGILYLNSVAGTVLNATGREWLLEEKQVMVKSARGKGKKRLPDPPRALLFDSSKTLRGVYGLCNEKSVDSLMLEYRILVSP